MTALEGTLPGAKNLNVDVAEENGNVVFLHKIVEGSASRSYGIHVAKLAGAPKELLERAQERLADLENGSTADAVVLQAQRAAGALQEQKTGEHGDLSAKKGMQDSDGAGTKSSAKGTVSEASEQLSFFDLAPVGYHAEAARSGSDEYYAVAGFADFRRTERVFIRVYYDSCIRETHCG